jgi:hypothetical protein
MTNKIIFLTFGNEKYYNSLERIKNEALLFNIFDTILIYNDIDLKNFFPDFWETHQNFILNNPRGYGYWLWKSYLVLKTLEKMNENDILIYADAGCTLNKYGIDRLNQYIDIVKNSNYGILSFVLPFLEKTYTKMDLFSHMSLINDEHLNSKHLMATIFILKKCSHTEFLINEWYKISSIYNLLNDSPSIINNDITFIEHRHDQSIFSLIRKKYGTELIPDETWSINWKFENIKNIPLLSTRYV